MLLAGLAGIAMTDSPVAAQCCERDEYEVVDVASVGPSASQQPEVASVFS